jgi:hypothetical protein
VEEGRCIAGEREAIVCGRELYWFHFFCIAFVYIIDDIYTYIKQAVLVDVKCSKVTLWSPTALLRCQWVIISDSEVLAV